MDLARLFRPNGSPARQVAQIEAQLGALVEAHESDREARVALMEAAQALLAAQPHLLEAQGILIRSATDDLRRTLPRGRVILAVIMLAVGAGAGAWLGAEILTTSGHSAALGASLRSNSQTLLSVGREDPATVKDALNGMIEADKVETAAFHDQRYGLVAITLFSSLLGGLLSWLVTILAGAAAMRPAKREEASAVRPSATG